MTPSLRFKTTLVNDDITTDKPYKPLLVIKGGVLDGKAITPAEVIRLADVEPREVLLAKLAGAMKATQARAAGAFSALPAQMAQLADALRAAATDEPTSR